MVLSWPSGNGVREFLMADIALRFHKDMLVLSSPVEPVLARQGVDVERDLEFVMLFEPDSLHDALRLQVLAGAPCLVLPTAGMTPARLTHHGMEEQAPQLVAAVMEQVVELKVQHLIAEVGPCGLPLDGSSKASLNEHRDQYARVGRLFAEYELDALFLNGFESAAALKCALMGLRQVSDLPVLASVNVRADGMLAGGRDALEEALAVMEDLGAQVAGFSTAAGPDEACVLAKRAARACDLPLLAQLDVAEVEPKAKRFGVVPAKENPYGTPDAVVDAALRLRAAGVQFLRAQGAAMPAYAGALAATLSGLDVAAVKL